MSDQTTDYANFAVPVVRVPEEHGRNPRYGSLRYLLSALGNRFPEAFVTPPLADTRESGHPSNGPRPRNEGSAYRGILVVGFTPCYATKDARYSGIR